MTFAIATPDGHQIVFSNKEEADAYIQKRNLKQNAYDADSSTHTQLDEILDGWAKKVWEHQELWSDPQTRQNWIDELDAMSISKDDKSFMRLEPTSRFNTTFEAFFSQIKRDANSSSKGQEEVFSYWKNGKKQPLNDEGGDTRGVESKLFDLGLDGKIPMAKVLDQHGLDNNRDGLKWQYPSSYQQDLEVLKNMPEMMKRYKNELSSTIINSEYPSRDLATFFDDYGRTPTSVKALGVEMIKDFLSAKPDYRDHTIFKAADSQKPDLLIAMAQAMPPLDEARFDDPEEQKKALNQSILSNWMPSKEDSEEMKKSKEEALMTLSNKGQLAAQKLLAGFYLNNGNASKAKLQIQRIKQNAFSKETDLDEVQKLERHLKDISTPKRGHSKLEGFLGKHSQKMPLNRQNTND